MAAPTTLPALLTSLTQSLSSALEVTPKIAAIEHQKDGISLLDVKNELLLSYLQNLVFLILLKLRNSKSENAGTDLDESVRTKLVELRLYLERGARPLEEKLRFSIDRFLRTADDAERDRKAAEERAQANGRTGSESDEESGSDEDEDDSEDESDEEVVRKPSKLSAAPNLGTLVDDVTAKPARGEGNSSGVYRPPKRDRHVMEPVQRRDRHERRPNKSRTMEEFVNSELSTAPIAEPSVGTTIVQRGRRMKTESERKVENERKEYEESNFTRLPAENKKDRAKRAKSEGRSGRMQFGGEEWHDLGEGVDRIDRLTKGKQSRGGVKAMLDKSRKRGFDTTDGPRGSGMAPGIGDRFEKRVKMLEGGRRDRGKGR